MDISPHTERVLRWITRNEQRFRDLYDGLDQLGIVADTVCVFNYDSLLEGLLPVSICDSDELYDVIYTGDADAVIDYVQRELDVLTGFG